MEKDKTHKPQNWREARRIRAWELKQAGWKQKDIAEALGVSEGAVSQWMKRVEEGGVEGLYHRKGGGPKPRLASHQLQKLPTFLSRGAEFYGFRGDVWTRERVKYVIKQEFEVSYSVSHVGDLLRQIGWSPQKPTHRASQRDEEAIDRWRTEKWITLKKSRPRGTDDYIHR